jgi:uncharacterized DUF497 family protein
VTSNGIRRKRTNVKKHGVDFADAALVLDDDQAITIREDEAGEERYVTVGMDPAMRILVVVYTWRDNSAALGGSWAPRPPPASQSV